MNNDIIHHDLKPQNIVFNEENFRLNFIDFGLMQKKSKIKSILNKNGEYWLTNCMNVGIEVGVAASSYLLDTAVEPEEKLYGYHRLEDPLIVDYDSEKQQLKVRKKSAKKANKKRTFWKKSEKNIIESELDLINQQILSKFNCAPYDLKENKDIKVEDTKLTHEELENRQNRLIRERDEMGPVNLRAEIEMKEFNVKNIRVYQC